MKHYRPPRSLQEFDPLARPVWYALKTPPQKEKAGREYLRANGIHAFYPDEVRQQRRQGKVFHVKRPMVSGFVFARFTGVPNWDVIRSRPFFSGVISYNGTPFPIQRADVLAMMGLRVTAKERQKALRARQAAIQAALAPVEGERAKIMEGPLSGFLVDVTEISGSVVRFVLPGGTKGSAGQGSLERVR